MTKKYQILYGVLAAFVIVLVLKTFVIEGLVVSGDSMLPTLHSGDYVFINRLAYVWSEPKRGDIIVATPRDYTTKVVKRVVALPGERVSLASGFNTNIDPQEYFVMGDNTAVSVDSVQFGGIDRWSIVGKVVAGIRFTPLRYLGF